MNQSNRLIKDIAVGFFMFMGVIGFISGEFIFSTTWFCAASVLSNVESDSEKN